MNNNRIRLFVVAVVLVVARTLSVSATANHFPGNEDVERAFSGTNSLAQAYAALQDHFDRYFIQRQNYDVGDTSRFSHCFMTNLIEANVSTNGYWLDDGFHHKLCMLDFLMAFDDVKTNIEDLCYIADYIGRIKPAQEDGSKAIEGHNLRMVKFRRLVIDECAAPIMHAYSLLPPLEQDAFKSKVISLAELSSNEVLRIFRGD